MAQLLAGDGGLIALMALVTLLAATLQSAIGFGFALLVVPPYLLLLESVAAIHLVIIVTLAISLLLLPALLRQVPWPLVRRLALGSLLGFPLGLYAYLQADLQVIKLAVGFIVTALALHLLLQRRRPTPQQGSERSGARPGRDYGVGLLSGAMATCLAMPGPAVMLHLASSGVGRQVIRAAILTLFVFLYGAALGLQAGFAGIARDTWVMAALLVPVAAVGTWIGHVASPHIAERAFRLTVLLVLLLTGLYMTVATLVAW